MFTTGQWLFGLLFFVAFIIILVFQYKKDLKIHKRYYKGAFWYLLAFISFIVLIATIKFVIL